MEKNQKMWVSIVAVVALVVLVFWLMNRNAPIAPVGNDDQTIQSTEDTTTGSINSGSPAASISYTNALVKYKDARLQLDKTCQGSPDKMTFKNGSFLMVDNRAPVARTVKVGSTFSIKAYGFKIVKLESATLPATWYVDCDASQNVSTILIQK